MGTFINYASKHLLAILLLFGGLSLALGALNSSDLNALPSGAAPLSTTSPYTFSTSNGGTVIVRATFIDPTTPQGQLCDGGRQRPNFSRYISDTGIIVGATSSVLVYDLDFAYRSCGKAVKNYAIYSPVYCEQAGWYGAGAQGRAFDCVKYAAGPSTDSATVVNPALGCPVNGTAGNGNPCVIQPFFNQIRVNSSAPYAPTSLVPSRVDDRVLPIGGSSINGLGLDTRSDGDRDFDAELCQYWKYTDDSAESSDNDGDDDCKRVAFNISWDYTPPPTYDLKATVSNLQSTFTYDTTGAVNWGAYAQSAANLQAGGVGYHEVDLWKIRFDGNPNYIAADTPTLGDGDLCSSYITGESGCIRAAAVGCPPGNPTYSCPNSINATGESWGFSYASAVETYPVGTNICYVARVKNPTQSSADDAVWRTSSMICSTSGTQPKVQSWGYDLKATGRIKTSLTDVGGRRYGSWGEYGVLSNGSTIGMASGSGLLGGEIAGAAQDNWSPLTFANDIGSAPGCGFGCFGGVAMPAVSTQGEVVRPDGYRVSSMAQLRADLGSGKGKLRVNGTLFIDGNLTYANPGAGVGIVGLEKVQLIANDIVIAGGVQTIDPWLIAYNASTNTYGRISTCADVNSGGNFFVPMGTSGLLRAGLCGSPLKFNSPVIADQIYLYRTADNREGTVVAETFNVRADNFLSSYVGGGPAQPVATTDSITELPPRF